MNNMTLIRQPVQNTKQDGQYLKVSVSAEFRKDIWAIFDVIFAKQENNSDAINIDSTVNFSVY